MKKIINLFGKIPKGIWVLFIFTCLGGFVWLSVAIAEEFGKYLFTTGLFGTLLLCMGVLLAIEKDEGSKIFGWILLGLGSVCAILFALKFVWDITMIEFLSRIF